MFDYGRAPGEWTLVGDGRHTADATGADLTIRLHTDMALGIEGNRVRARHILHEGERLYCALSWAEGLASPADVAGGRCPADADHGVLAVTGWAGARLPDHRYRPAIERSALAIKGLTYMPTGATVAAATTSLPETPGGERNWDYRYTWIRDSTFTLQALHFLNLDWEANEFMQFIADLELNEDGALQIMYGIDGRRDLTEIDRRRALGLRRCAPGARSATAPSTSARTTCSARRWTRSCCTRAAASACRGGCGRSCRRRPSARRRSGSSPTRASGRRAARRSTTSPRS